MMGQLVAQQELTANSQTALGISGTGYYLVKVVTTGNTYSGKVFVNQ
jgi:hypothetical protein